MPQEKLQKDGQNMFGSNWSSWHLSALGFTVLSLRDGTAVGHVVPVMRPQQLATHLPTCTSSFASMVPQHLDVEHDRIGLKATKHVIADTTFIHELLNFCVQHLYVCLKRTGSLNSEAGKASEWVSNPRASRNQKAPMIGERFFAARTNIYNLLQK